VKDSINAGCSDILGAEEEYLEAAARNNVQKL
jgi:hypothetical protein